ncbi:MAG: hypothetical protein IKQ60_10945 [Candidatus Methanomethylophilaceae archaeon]|nr:hypothetical protein [Candidatus Methanomethylophilaceae archaeon]
MKGRQTIRTEKDWDIESLQSFLEQRWNSDIGPAPVIKDMGMSVRYLQLPATYRYCVMIQVAKGKLVLFAYPTASGWSEQFVQSIPVHSVVGGYMKISSIMDKRKERTGPAEEMLLKYTEVVRSLLECCVNRLPPFTAGDRGPGDFHFQLGLARIPAPGACPGGVGGDAVVDPEGRGASLDPSDVVHLDRPPASRAREPSEVDGSEHSYPVYHLVLLLGWDGFPERAFSAEGAILTVSLVVSSAPHLLFRVSLKYSDNVAQSSVCRFGHFG